MPIELTIDEICERLGKKGDPVLNIIVTAMLYHTKIPNRMVATEDGRGYERKFVLKLESDLPPAAIVNWTVGNKK